MTKGKLLLVDDEVTFLQAYILELKGAGYDVYAATTIEEAQKELSSAHYDLLIVDVIMPLEEKLEILRGATITNVGLHFATEVRKRYSEVRVIVFSQAHRNHMPSLAAFDQDPEVRVLQKGVVRPPMLVQEVALLLMNKRPGPKVFIVHGHDRAALFELKNYLQNTLGFQEPLILAEEASTGATIIEKFEEYSSQIDIAFVLMTPDDVAYKAGITKSRMLRARQNVIFELGYFIGILGRRSGRVFILHKGKLELPSDLAGVVYIDISNGVEAAGEDVRRELGPWL